MNDDKTISYNTESDADAMEALDMAMGINLETDVWVCTVCGYEYSPLLGDPEHGIPKGTPFQDLPDNWTCPRCHAPKDKFEPKVEINDDGKSWTNS